MNTYTFWIGCTLLLNAVYLSQMSDFQYSYSNVIAKGEMRWQWFCISRETCCNGQPLVKHWILTLVLCTCVKIQCITRKDRCRMYHSKCKTHCHLISPLAIYQYCSSTSRQVVLSCFSYNQEKSMTTLHRLALKKRVFELRKNL